MQDPPALRESGNTDGPRLKPVSNGVAGRGMGGGGDRQDCPAYANSPALGTSCGVAQSQKKGQVWVRVAHASLFPALDVGPHGGSMKEPKSDSRGVKGNPGQPAPPGPEPLSGLNCFTLPPWLPSPLQPQLLPPATLPRRQSCDVSYSLCLHQPLLPVLLFPNTLGGGTYPPRDSGGGCHVFLGPGR